MRVALAPAGPSREPAGFPCNASEAGLGYGLLPGLGGIGQGEVGPVMRTPRFGSVEASRDDRAGRLQIPSQMLEEIGAKGNKVKLEVVNGRIQISAKDDM